MHTVKKTLLVLTVAASAIATAGLSAQWPAFSAPGIPKTADGKIDYKAPAPRTADGKPDLSGVWETAPCPDCAPPVIDGLSPTPGSGQAAAQAGRANDNGNGQPARDTGNAQAAAGAGTGRVGGRGNGGFGRNIFGNV